MNILERIRERKARMRENEKAQRRAELLWMARRDAGRTE